jgi:hypothetical protein
MDHFGPFRPEHQPAVATDASDFLPIRLDAGAHSLPGRKQPEHRPGQLAPQPHSQRAQ